MEKSDDSQNVELQELKSITADPDANTNEQSDFRQAKKYTKMFAYSNVVLLTTVENTKSKYLQNFLLYLLILFTMFFTIFVAFTPLFIL